MNGRKEIQIHYIADNKLLFKRWLVTAPLVGDEIRIGGEGKEQFYSVTRRVWVYDEPEIPFLRLNIGIELIEP